MTLDREAVLEILSRSNAYLKGHFRLSSGLHSSRYLQCAVALQNPGVATRLGSALADRWRELARGEVRGVVSPALGGVIIGHEVGRALGCRAIFTERVDGRMVLRRGFSVAPDERLLVVEDVVTTGRSTRETLAVLQELGARPLGVACIANRSGSSELDALPLVELVRLDFPAYEATDCPECATGAPLQSPGSRHRS